MKIFRFFILPVLAMLSFSSYAIHVAAVHPNSEILTVKSNTKVCFVYYRTQEGNKYYAKWDCDNNYTSSLAMFELAKLSYSTGARVTITLGDTGHGSSTGDSLVGIEMKE
ncbi:MAG: hypothetical protein QRY16_21085 [Enterobacterales bacterium endosymbiont of Blomia tropicalis]|uniref:hypothetical protein n=1 Tax=Mixta mediterraneensis TaxID=2758443 RepID=UPI0025A80410|nr:hypothetical protein [Mixta mediterraneensis]MDL4916162.1 hypothetical protein [Mixta mediterraneensis]